MGTKRRNIHGGPDRRQGRTKGAKDRPRIGGRHTEATRNAMAVKVLVDTTGCKRTEAILATIAKPTQSVDDADKLQTAREMYSRRNRKWQQPVCVRPVDASGMYLAGHAGYLEVRQAYNALLDDPVFCPGGAACPDLDLQGMPAWRKHWHCEVCGHPDEEPVPARLVSFAPGLTLTFIGWFCGKCIWAKLDGLAQSTSAIDALFGPAQGAPHARRLDDE